MAKVDLARRAEIGREKREKTRALILDAGTMLMAERPREAVTIDAVVEAAGVAKGTFYYHFQSIDELAAAVGEKLGESFDAVLGDARRALEDPLKRLSFAFTKFLEKAISDANWARLVVQSSQSRGEYARGVRTNLKADIAQAIVQERVSIRDAELAVDIVMGIWLQVTRGILDRGTRPEVTQQTVESVLRALGASRSDQENAWKKWS
ncbi:MULTISPECIES: TetR/AcrR family transcriptional regulator [unclassified Mesorhizobium]|uniref:TetR/AcrR family transcriptional regulator n=1 Tax=unclassified Mesorhizobium TaxID=325217 RepID=UPI00112E915C|nr:MULTISPECIES: TetR/AcrR family transcriptional regulator [unclassified Mesorhizobium]TPI77694.1 TetR/AcrR family transcriptional regulator [Mesorhizobium sp. B2-8-9]TPJ30845.1 TetR/AcrR family transcriptional regulator [Mesorhizobium sp. B2-7-2]